MNLKRICSLVVFCLLMNQSNAADLIETYQLAVKNDATLSAARLNTDAKILGYDIEQAELYPSITFQPNYSRERSVFGSTDSGLLFEVVVDQPVWSPALQEKIHQKQQELSLYDLQLKQVEGDLISRVVLAYFNVLYAQDNLDTVERESLAIEELLSQELSRLGAGLGTLADVRIAQARFSLVTAELVRAESGIESAWLSLRELVGDRTESLSNLRDHIEISPPEPENLDWWVDTAFDNNLALMLQQKAAEISQLGISLSTAESQPRLTLRLSYKDVVSGDRIAANRSSAFLNFSKKFSAGGLEKYRKKQARLLHQSEEQKLIALTQQVKTQVSNDYLNVISSVNQVSALETALDASQSALEATQEGYNVGTQSSLDVLNAQHDLLEVRRDLQKAKYDYFRNLIMLERSAGLLDLADLERINLFLQ